MELFLQNVFSFPVIIYSGMLVIAALYWLSASLGILEIDALDMDMEAPDVAADVSFEGSAEGGGAELAAGLSSLLFALGLYGVPMTLILTFITMFGWLLSYFVMYWGLRFLDPGLIRYGMGVLTFLGAFLTATFATAFLIKPLRPLFNKGGGEVRAKSLLGQAVIIRSEAVTTERGEAVYEDGGAGLILQVRSIPGSRPMVRGEAAVILEYRPAQHVYTIITEDEFKGL